MGFRGHSTESGTHRSDSRCANRSDVCLTPYFVPGEEARAPSALAIDRRRKPSLEEPAIEATTDEHQFRRGGFRPPLPLRFEGEAIVDPLQNDTAGIIRHRNETLVAQQAIPEQMHAGVEPESQARPIHRARFAQGHGRDVVEVIVVVGPFGGVRRNIEAHDMGRLLEEAHGVDIGTHRVFESSHGIQATHEGLDLPPSAFVHQVTLVEDQVICERDLLPGRGLLQGSFRVGRIDHPDDGAGPKGLHHTGFRDQGAHEGRGLGQARGFDQDTVEGLGPAQEPPAAPALELREGLHEVAPNGATDAPAAELDEVLLGRDHRAIVDPDLAELVDQHREPKSPGGREESIEERGLARSEPAAQEVDGNSGVGGSRQGRRVSGALGGARGGKGGVGGPESGAADGISERGPLSCLARIPPEGPRNIVNQARNQSGRGGRRPAGRRSGGGSSKPRGPRKPKVDVEPLHPVEDPPEVESFQEFDLGDKVQAAIAEMGITRPTPIQSLAIQPVLEGRDVIAKAETGTGKTLAFGAPMMARIDPERSSVLALVLCPTRELAQQVANVLEKLGEAIGAKVALVVGGEPIFGQIDQLKSGAQVVVGTPGRVLDLQGQGFLTFPWTEYAVLDEADEMLEIGFLDDVRKIFGFLPEERQTLLFSATFPTDLLILARENTKDPAEIATAKGVSTVDTITQSFMTVSEEDRPMALVRMLEQTSKDDVFLIFCDRRTEVDQLIRRLGRLPFEVKALHGGYDQASRFRVMSAFRTGDVKALVATDVASRGLDVDHVTHVINFSVPNDVSTYTHRIGRTGRAGREGAAITFVTPKLAYRWRQIERDATWEIEEIDAPGRTGSYRGSSRREGSGEGRGQQRRQGRDGEERRPRRENRDEGRGRSERPERGRDRDEDARERRPRREEESRSEERPARRDEASPAAERVRSTGRRLSTRERLRLEREGASPEAPRSKRNQDRGSEDERPPRSREEREQAPQRGRRPRRSETEDRPRRRRDADSDTRGESPSRTRTDSGEDRPKRRSSGRTLSTRERLRLEREGKSVPETTDEAPREERPRRRERPRTEDRPDEREERAPERERSAPRERSGRRERSRRDDAPSRSEEREQRPRGRRESNESEPRETASKRDSAPTDDGGGFGTGL